MDVRNITNNNPMKWVIPESIVKEESMRQNKPVQGLECGKSCGTCGLWNDENQKEE